MNEEEEFEIDRINSVEVFHDVLQKISSLGDRGKSMLQRLMKEIDKRGVAEDNPLKQLVNETMSKTLSTGDKRRVRRELALRMLREELMEDDDDGDAPIEEVITLILYFII